jgi:preprotein translocase subunit SecD
MMMIRSRWFNIYLLLVLGLTWGCHSPDRKQKSQVSTLRVHLETNPTGTERTRQASVYREHPFVMNIEKDCFLSEANVSEARVVEEMGGFDLRIKFNSQGSRLLEQYSAANRGKHFAIFSQFTGDPEGKKLEARWLAAPKISKRLADGVLTFAPDATKEEAQQIAIGLNNAARNAGNAPE